MKMKELVETPLGVLAVASIQNHPELETTTPAIARSLRDWARANGYTLQAVICALLNWLATECDDAPHKLAGLDVDREIDPTAN